MTAIRRWTGVETKALRDTLKLSQREFADIVDVHYTRVSRWETSKADAALYPRTESRLDAILQKASANEQALFAALLAGHATPSSYPMTAAETAEAIGESTASDMATRRAFMAGLSILSGTALILPIRQWAATVPIALSTPNMTHADELIELEQAASCFRRWDNVGSGGQHRTAVVEQLHATAEILIAKARETRTSTDITQRLFQVGAELAQLAAWICYDAGLYERAQKYFFLALHATHHANAPEFGAKIVGDLIQMSTSRGNYNDSVALVRTALSALPRDANPLVRSELYGLEARACAHLGSGETSHARRAIEACVEVFHDEGVRAVKPDWLHYMNEAEVGSLAANTYIQLSLQDTQTKRARVHASHAEQHTLATIKSRGPGYTRSAALDDIRLCKVRVAQGEPEEAVRVATTALERIGAMPSSVVVAWFLGLHEILLPRYGDVAGMDTFQSGLIEYLGRVSPERRDELLAQGAN